MTSAAAADRGSLAALATGHACADLCQGAVPALVPFLVSDRGLTLGQTGALMLVMTLGSSVLQPLFGHLADRWDAAWLLPTGLLLGAGGVAGLGIFAGFGVSLLAVGLSGLGVGAFHPEAAHWPAGRPAAGSPAG